MLFIAYRNRERENEVENSKLKLRLLMMIIHLGGEAVRCERGWGEELGNRCLLCIANSSTDFHLFDYSLCVRCETLSESVREFFIFIGARANLSLILAISFILFLQQQISHIQV